MADICTKCGLPVQGGFQVREHTLPDGTPEIVIEGTPDRDFNVCDDCNISVHFACSLWPESGLCDDCFKADHPLASHS
jgi:hypothetical protein